jgi:hypothetical protein
MVEENWGFYMREIALPTLNNGSAAARNVTGLSNDLL